MLKLNTPELNIVSMLAHAVALAMLGTPEPGLFTVDAHEIAAAVIAIANEGHLEMLDNMDPDTYYKILRLLVEGEQDVNFTYDLFPGTVKQCERECRLAILHIANDHIEPYINVWEQYPEMRAAVIHASHIEHLVMAFDISRERILNWYINYLVRIAQISVDIDYCGFSTLVLPSEWGLTDDEDRYCKHAYYEKIHQTGYKLLDIANLEMMQASDVQREYERRVCIRMLPDLGVILDLARIAASYC